MFKTLLALLLISPASYGQSFNNFVPPGIQQHLPDEVLKNPAVECFNSQGFYVKNAEYNMKKLHECILLKAEALSKQSLVNLGEGVVDTSTKAVENAESVYECFKRSSGLWNKSKCFVPASILNLLNKF